MNFLNSIDFSRYQLVLERPHRLTDITSWHGHIPFAFFIVQAMKPRTVVELGTHKGDSYCAFCQAVKTLKIKCSCFAVDTWKGDTQAGFYGEEVIDELRRFHDVRYGYFSELIRDDFDKALTRFSDGSIDLLHIDGCHSYETVKRDFDMWLPKMSRVGVILMHDTRVKEGEFGVWRLWEELSSLYDAFEFDHSHGLGVLSVGKEVTDELRPLFYGDHKDKWLIRNFFGSLGENILLRNRIGQMAEIISNLQSMANRHQKMIESKDASINALKNQKKQILSDPLDKKNF